MNLPPELRCPEHRAPLVASGVSLDCAQGCRTPVVDGIPRFVDSSLYAAAFGRQWKAHPRTQLDSDTGVPISRDRLVRCLGGSLDAVRGKTVLEVGCGAGRFTEILLEAGARVVACDLSDAVEVNAANCGGPAHFPVQADVLRLPVAQAAFDVVLALGVVQHTPNPEASIAALANCVRPGGLLVLDHYTVLPRDTWLFRTLTALHPRSVVRELLLRLPGPFDTRAADLVTRVLLPVHRAFWRPGAAVGRVRRLLRRASPLSDYYDRYSQLGPERLAEWSRLDTHDALTDRYKHLRNPEQIAAALRFAGMTDIEVAYGGNGVEARARRPSVNVPREREPVPRHRQALRVIVVARLDDAKLASKIEPLLDLPEVAEVVVVRRTALRLPGVRNVCPPAFLSRASLTAEPWRLMSLLREAARAPERTVLVSFFLMPHAVHVDWTRRLLRVPTIPVLIGDEDVARAETSPFFRNVLEAALAIGVRGERSAGRLAALGLPREKLFCPPNTYDVSPFLPDPAVAQDVDVCFVGKLYSSKRVDVLLEAAARVRARRGGVRVAMVGDGPDRARAEADTRRLGLSEDVVFTGALPPEGVASWLRRSRLFVMTSEQEGLPMAMIEALTSGVPVVVGDVGDVTSVARHGENAWIVPERTPETFAAAITHLLDDEALRARLSAGARSLRPRFDAEYSLDAARAAWHPVLARLLDARRGRA